jgi:hypothetical protein
VNESPNDRQQGQSIVIVAAALIVLLIFAAIAVDLANAYFHRRTAQNAADAAAFAGARELASMINKYDTDHDGYINGVISELPIQASMNDFAERNGIEDTDGVPANHVNTNVTGFYLRDDGSRLSDGSNDIEIGALGLIHPQARGVEAIAESLAPSYFSGIIGYDGFPVDAEAAVVFGGACADSCIMPIATLTETFQFTTCYNIYDGWESGSFGWLHWGFQKDAACRCNVPCLRDNINPMTCSSGRIEYGDWVASDSGVSNDIDVRNQMNCYAGLPLEPGGSVTCDCPPQPFTVIVYDITQDMNGKADECAKGGTDESSQRGLGYHVVGFAKFQLLGYSLSSGGGGGSSAGHDGEGCLNECAPDRQNCENRLTGRFMGWAEGEGGYCDPVGTIIAPMMIK